MDNPNRKTRVHRRANENHNRTEINTSNITNGLEVFRVGHLNLGPDQVERAKDYFLQDATRDMHPCQTSGSNVQQLPHSVTYVLRDVLLRTPQSQSIRQTHCETMGVFTFEKLSLDEILTKSIFNRRANKGSGTNIFMAERSSKESTWC